MQKFSNLGSDGNPLNTITLLATGAAGPAHWWIFLGLLGGASALGVVTDRYARHTAMQHLTE